jgi:REP element-mobilizing transposase RayT
MWPRLYEKEIMLYKNTYRVESIRLKEWDYSTPWWYFVTINTRSHICLFGEVIDSNMILNDLGADVQKIWEDIPSHYSNTELDYFQIMPNHIHGIIIINNAKPVKAQKNITLSNVIRSFKSAVTKHSNETVRIKFSWQPRFYERIIRNEKELFLIRKYIQENPLKWEIEKNQPDNLEL